MDDLDVFVGLGTRGTGKSNPMRPDRRSVNDPTGFDYDSIFRSNEKTSYEGNGFDRNSNTNNNGGGNDLPVYDKPVYDDDIFDGLPGLKSNKSNLSPSKDIGFDNDVFASVTGKSGSEFDDLLGNLGKSEKDIGDKTGMSPKGFDDLFTGLGSGSSGVNSNRPISESRWGSVPSAGSKHENIVDDPFVVLESNSTSGSPFGVTDPLDEISKHSKSKSAKVEASFGSAAAFNDLDPLNNLGKSGKSTNPLSPPRDNIIKDGSPPKSTTSQFGSIREPKSSSSRHLENKMNENVPVDIFQEPPLFDAPDVSSEFQKSFGQKGPSPPHRETGMQADTSSTSRPANPFDDIWLTVSEIPLFTQPTSAPPPSRVPPVPYRTSRSETSTYSSSSREKSYEFSSPPNPGQDYQSLKLGRPEVKGRPVSQFDELEEFAMGKSQSSYDGSANAHSSMDGDAFSAAAASAAAKDAMDKAEAKFRHAKELREREHAKAARSKESVLLEKDDEARKEKELRETQERIERESKQKEEEEREQRRREREREREIRLREMERERSRQAVERATREARERAAAEARMRAERSAVEKANAEARERAERAAVQRAQAEARERAAAEARERAEKAAEARGRAEKAAEAREREMAAAVARERAAAAEAREKEMREKAAAAKADAEARRRAERAAVERVAAEARERAAAEARERAAAAAKMNQQKNDNDLESFFSMGRASSAPRARTSATDPLFDTRFQNKAGSDAAKVSSSSSGTSSNMRKASSTTNFVDDLSSIFGAAAPSGEFQEVDGESDERRRARLERHQRTQERAAKALAEKNQRDLQAQREQEERHRIAETLDTEIKRWAAGKEGNLRALLSTLQYVLWAECGWQPVSLTDLITGASVKKVYRKATLCIHPDKVQQKGATLQQKYIAEKVFDLLKEAWNKFNSEELF